MGDIKSFENFKNEQKVTIGFMYGDGDEYYDYDFYPSKYNTTKGIIDTIYTKCSGYEIDTIFGQINSNESDRLTDEELSIFRDIYDDIPDLGGFKEYNYVFVE